MKKNNKKKSLRSIVNDQPNSIIDSNAARKLMGGFYPWVDKP